MLTMFDAIYPSAIPPDAPAVAGYVNGHWPTHPALVKGWPHAKHLSIDVFGTANADCVDVERGDVTNDHVAGWVKRQQARGLKWPVVYTSVANVQALMGTLAAAGIGRSQIRLWTAHYSYKPHICGPACSVPGSFTMPTTADATQWTNRSHGRSLDESLCADHFFNPGAPPVPTPKPKRPTDVVSDAEWLWRQWAFGEGKFAASGPFEGIRPVGLPSPVPVEWHVRAIKFLLAREPKA